ncbi:MAG: M13 family metallopeptidase [Saprospiraceae bacterium]|nr:M13 family metallopeptidase [Saprospiraceae bacterium]
MAKGINTKFLDTTTLPGEDFYQFVNGGWIQTTEIPADRSTWGSFHELSKNTDALVIAILEEELSIPGPAENKAARLFQSGMDTVSIEAARLSPLVPLFEKVGSLQSIQTLPGVLGHLAAKGFRALMHFSVHPDLGNSKQYAAYIEVATLGLPEREFYLEDNEKAERIRDKYLDYIAQLLQSEANYSSPQSTEAANAILSFEKELASKIMTKEERRQIAKLYNPHTPKQLKALMPFWDWDLFFIEMEVSDLERLIVTEPDFCVYLNTMLQKMSLSTIKQYLTFLLIHHSAPYVHSEIEKAHFDLYARTLEGIESMRPRRERLVKVVNQNMGELLGQLFVTKNFPRSAKETALEMTSDIVEAFRERITSLHWMSKSTKDYALEKLTSFKVKIGYPDKWKDYSTLDIKTKEAGSCYLENMMAIVSWNLNKDATRIGKEVDREEWFMAPQVVNAYYNPMFNEIVFPAAILQPPFFDWEADAAVNYGGIGAVIGHEITHGFDDQGSRFDKEGNLNEWWTAEDRERFQSLTGRLIKQFDAYFPFEDLSVNGTFTLGENIADLGGLSVAYDALQLYYKRHGKPEKIDGFTPEQRFFMSWATVWRTKIRPEALRNQIKTDPHPPGMYRAVAAPSNMDSFYHAFEIIPDSKWHRNHQERIKIW